MTFVFVLHGIVSRRLWRCVLHGAVIHPGHAAGDALLRDIATGLGRVVTPNDLVARLGGAAVVDELDVADGDAEVGVARVTRSRLLDDLLPILRAEAGPAPGQSRQGLVPFGGRVCAGLRLTLKPATSKPGQGVGTCIDFLPSSGLKR